MGFKIYTPSEIKIPETGLQSGMRNLVSSGAKAVSDVANIPGAVSNMAQDIIQQPDTSLQKSAFQLAMAGSPEAKVGMGLLKGIGEGVDIASKGVKSIFPR